MRLAVSSPFELGSGRREASGCVTGVLRRILCRNLRDRKFVEEDEVVQRKEEQGKSDAVTAASSSPGIVAMLMGLESSPAFPYARPETISRTRSANSAEPWKAPGILGEQSGGGNVGSELRKSQSFREVRSYLRKESEEFLVLSFGDDDESEASEMNAKKMDFGFEQHNTKERKLVEKKRSRNKNLANSAEMKQNDAKSSVSSMGKPNEIAERRSSSRKKISFGQGEMEIECSSQNSSPVSVLDLPLDADGDCLTSPDSSISVCKISMLKSEEEDSRKKVLLEVEDESKKAGKCGSAPQNFSDIWAHICSLGEDDLNNSKWIKANMIRSEEAEEIGFGIEHEIFEFLLHEAAFDVFN